MAELLHFVGRQEFRRVHFQKEFSPALGGIIALAVGILTYQGGGFISKLQHAKWSNFANWDYVQLVLIFGSAVIVLFTFAYVLPGLYRSARLTQEDRNFYADRIVQNAGHNQRNEFSLYLRPFVVDDAVNFKTARNADDRFIRLTNDTFENTVAQAVDRLYPIVAIGRPWTKYGPGAGEINDAKWREIALRLMVEAKMILMIPIAQPSTLWELQQLFLYSHWTKTVFVVPPHANVTLAGKSVIGQNVPLSSLYKYSQNELKKLGFDLPTLDERGGMYWYHGKDGIGWRARIFAESTDLSFRTIRRILIKDIGSQVTADELTFSTGTQDVASVFPKVARGDLASLLDRLSSRLANWRKR